MYNTLIHLSNSHSKINKISGFFYKFIHSRGSSNFVKICKFCRFLGLLFLDEIMDSIFLFRKKENNLYKKNYVILIQIYFQS